MCFSLDTLPQIDNRLLGILFCAEGRHFVFFFFKGGSKCLRHCNFCLNEEWTSALGQESKAWEWNGIVTLHHRNSWCNMIKGIIYPKMKIILYSPTDHSKPVWCSIFIRAQKDILSSLHAAFCHTIKRGRWPGAVKLVNLLFTSSEIYSCKTNICIF